MEISASESDFFPQTDYLILIIGGVHCNQASWVIAEPSTYYPAAVHRYAAFIKTTARFYRKFHRRRI